MIFKKLLKGDSLGSAAFRISSEGPICILILQGFSEEKNF
jgi:hypothetical protein